MHFGPLFHVDSHVSLLLLCAICIQSCLFPSPDDFQLDRPPALLPAAPGGRPLFDMHKPDIRARAHASATYEFSRLKKVSFDGWDGGDGDGCLGPGRAATICMHPVIGVTNTPLG